MMNMVMKKEKVVKEVLAEEEAVTTVEEIEEEEEEVAEVPTEEASMTRRVKLSRKQVVSDDTVNYSI